MEGEVLRRQGEYWKESLAGAPALLELPADHARPVQQDFAGGWASLELDKNLTEGLRELGRRQGTTLFMTLLAGWAALLGRLSGQRDVVIGFPSANRGRAEIEGLIGFFINTLALRVDVSGTPTVGELLGRVKEQTLEAQQNQDIPFEQVVELVSPVRSLAHSPLLQSMFGWQNTPRERLELQGLEIRAMETASKVVSKFDFSLALREAGERIVGVVEYARSLFEQETVERYVGYFIRLLEGMVMEEGESLVVDRLPLLSQEERGQVLYGWNETSAEYPRGQCIHELFEEQAGRKPEAIAVVFEGSALSYGELNGRANRLGRYLRELGVKPDTRVAICMERGLEMVVGLLGVLKAGGAYVPLDPGYPEERLRYMLEDSAPVALLTQGNKKGMFAGVREDLVEIDLEGAGAWEGKEDSNLEGAEVGLRAEHLAYVIYTSGSTGLPKGVAIEHRSLGNLIHWHLDAFELDHGQRSSSVAGFGFDAATWEIWPTLCVGATLLLPAAGSDAEGLLRWWENQILDVSFLPTPIAEFAFTQGISNASLKRLLVGGDRLRLLPENNPGFSLINNYGPTEATVVATSGRIDPSGKVIPIGRPIANTRVYILDEQMEPVPVGVSGELYIAGAGVARGYLNRPELTGERFVKDPFAREGEGGARMYKTGDRGRWLADGTIEFLGRNDFQVKIRGFRIELGEIEARLGEVDGVGEVVVAAREDEPGDKRLVAYYTVREEEGLESEGRVSAEQLRGYLIQRLPEYMVPAAYVLMEKLPLTANGKVDRQGLPAPEAVAYGARRYEPPVGEMEKAVARIWAELLKVEQIGRQDDFFALGGHSLLAVQAMTRLQQEMGVDVSPWDLFTWPVLADLVQTLDSAESNMPLPITRVERHERSLPLTPDVITATGPNGHRIASRDNGVSWFDLQTGKIIE
jgi:amino acid adenylation domain-containing protein